MSAGAGLVVDVSQPGPIPLSARFVCAPGEVLALVGPSGSGKSTILRVIAGTYRPQSGHVAAGDEIWLDTREKRALPPHRRRVGMVFQNYALFPHLTALGNIAAAMGHRPAAQRLPFAARLLEKVHLGGLGDRRPAELSGGQQQRVAVARALAREPKVLLLDEPFSAVDKATRQRLYREIAGLRAELNMPVVLVTHDLDEATMLADQIAVIHRGRTLQIAPPAELTARPASADIARLLDFRNIFTGTVRHLDAGGGYGIDWVGVSLHVPAGPYPMPPPGAANWVIPDGFVMMHRRDKPSRGDHENPVPGMIESLIVIGQIAHLTLRPNHAPEHPLHFTMPLHVLHRNAVATGQPATVSLIGSGIHVLPEQAGT
jgi:molybdate transport system ATP-binding protein